MTQLSYDFQGFFGFSSDPSSSNVSIGMGPTSITDPKLFGVDFRATIQLPDSFTKNAPETASITVVPGFNLEGMFVDQQDNLVTYQVGANSLNLPTPSQWISSEELIMPIRGEGFSVNASLNILPCLTAICTNGPVVNLSLSGQVNSDSTVTFLVPIPQRIELESITIATADGSTYISIISGETGYIVNNASTFCNVSIYGGSSPVTVLSATMLSIKAYLDSNIVGQLFSPISGSVTLHY